MPIRTRIVSARAVRLLTLLVCVCSGLVAVAQAPIDTTPSVDSVSATSPGTAPVVFAGDTVYTVPGGVGPFTAAQRARLVGENIAELSNLPATEFDSLFVVASEDGGYGIRHRDALIATVTLSDAAAVGESAESLAARNREAIVAALRAERSATSVTRIARDVAVFALMLGLLVLQWRGINFAFDYARKRLREGLRAFVARYSTGSRGKLFQLLGPATQAKLLLGTLRVTRVLTLLFLLYLFLPFVFSQLVYTRGFGERLFEYVMTPVRFVVGGVVGFIPELVFILVISWIGYQFIRLVGWFAEKIATDQITIEGFHNDWALPTANLVRVLIVVLTIIVVYPYLPGSNSDAFKGVSVFIGLLLSLGGAAAVGNVVSGVILTYMRPFQVGHRVRINDNVGDITSKNLLVTRIRTTKNEEITVPNGALLSGGIVNYTVLAETHGLVLHTSVTIGYDVPWPQVHELLLAAAAKTDRIEAAPAPFILQKALQDWYVEYELNATTRDSHAMALTYSELHANIQDVFRDAGVEIMSSHYMHVRTGNETTIPTPAAQRPPTLFGAPLGS